MTTTPIIRIIRKCSHLGRMVAVRGARFLERVEHKATTMIADSEVLQNSHGRVVTTVDGLLSQHLPQAMRVYPALPKAGRKPAVTLFIPTLSNELIFGGIATALIVAVTIAKKSKRNLRVVQTFKYGNADIRSFLEEKQIDFQGDVLIEDITEKSHNKKLFIDIHPEDIFMASAWADAYIINQLPLGKKFVYLMQDFEPIFYPNGDEKIRAESTYRSSNYIAICNTKLLHDHIASQNYPEFDRAFKTWFEPAVALDTTNSKIKPSKDKKVMFVYGRPRVKRNLFLAAIEAVNRVASTPGFDASLWKIYIAGEDGVPDIHLDGGVWIENLGKMSLHDYYAFVRGVDVAVSPMMAPHPNYPTLELASAGARVVTTSFGVKQELSKYSQNIVVADPSIDSIYEAIYAEVIEAQQGRPTNNDPIKLVGADWDANLKGPVDDLLANL